MSYIYIVLFIRITKPFYISVSFQLTDLSSRLVRLQSCLKSLASKKRKEHSNPCLPTSSPEHFPSYSTKPLLLIIVAKCPHTINWNKFNNNSLKFFKTLIIILGKAMISCSFGSTLSFLSPVKIPDSCWLYRLS